MSKLQKKEVLDAFLTQLSKRISDIEQNLLNIEQSKAQETKSSAGDKFETGRAMLQAEEDKLFGQLNRNKDLLLKLKVIMQSNLTSSSIREGSLVFSDKQVFFLGLGLGKVVCSGKQVFSVSSEAPLAKKLYGKSVGDSFEINGQEYKIAIIL